MLKTREEILEKVTREAERIIVVDQKGIISDEEAEEILNSIAEYLSGFNEKAVYISKDVIKNDLVELISIRKVNINSYWQKDRPITTPMKGILNTIKQKYELSFSIEEALNYLSRAYPVVGNYVFYICPLRVFDNIAVNDADSGSCFRYYKANYRHYDFLLSINEIGDAEAKYLLIDNGNKLARAWLIANSNVAVIFNVYSDIMTLDSIKYPSARAMAIYRDWNGVKFNYDRSACFPIYTNSGLLIIYNREKIANSRIALSKISDVRGKCTDCGEPIEIGNATSDNGHILCSYCNDRDIYRCTNCGEEINEEDVHWYNDEPYCEECFYDFAFYCYHCGEATHRDDGYVGVNDRLYCEYCFDRFYTYCDKCGEPELIDNAIMVNDEVYCSYCTDRYLTECSECGTYILNEDAIEINGSYYCQKCVENNFRECEVCGKYTHKDEIQEIGDKILCEDCARDYDVCAKCGKAFHVNEMDYYEDTGYLCKACDKQIDLITEEVA